MRDQPHGDHPPRRWLVMVTTTIAAWLVAFLVVMALLTLFGDQLAALPLALRALVISGVLVALMVNLVMPVLSAAVARRLAGGTLPRPTQASDGPATTHIRPTVRTSTAEADHNDSWP